jgi:hypothetical protein
MLYHLAQQAFWHLLHLIVDIIPIYRCEDLSL